MFLRKDNGRTDGKRGRLTSLGLAWVLAGTLAWPVAASGWTSFRSVSRPSGGWWQPSWSGGIYTRPAPAPAPAPNPAPSPAPAPQQPEPAPAPRPVPPGTDSAVLTSDEAYLVQAINAARTSAGRAALTVDARLVRLARLKAQEMLEQGYFSHYSPTYGSPYEMLQSFGIAYRYAGENIARASNVQVAHEALMQSEGHRANILSSAYTLVGVGVASSGYRVVVVELFMRP